MHRIQIVLLITILLFGLSGNSFSQVMLKGTVVDSKNKKPVPYAAVGIIGTYMGTVANDLGEFELYLVDADTSRVKVSSIGYKSQVIEDFPNKPIVIALEQSAVVLNEMIVYDLYKDPFKVLRKAFRLVKKNYLTDPFTMNVFYRHYCKDDSIYGRLIEAAGEIYKPKGYSRSSELPANQHQIHLSQLRRSFDMSLLKRKNAHIPIGVDNILSVDFVGYADIRKAMGSFMVVKPDSSFSLNSNYSFTFNGTTSYDGQNVYKIGYQYHGKKDKLYSRLTWHNYKQTGELFINQDDYAIVKAENLYNWLGTNFKQIAYYRKNNGRYVLSHAIEESTNDNLTGKTHHAHIEMLINDVKIGKNNTFKGQKMTHQVLSKVPYEPEFWDNYNVIKRNRLEDRIKSHLERNVTLNQQFFIKQQQESLLYDEEVINTNAVESFIEANEEKVIVLHFWSLASKSDITAIRKAKKTLSGFKKKGVIFLFLATDGEELKQKWEETVKFPPFDEYVQYRIGDNSRLIGQNDVNDNHRYVVFYKGKSQQLYLPMPVDQEFKEILDNFLSTIASDSDKETLNMKF